MAVFDHKERTDGRPKTRREGTFEFYDRVSWQSVGVFRDLVNQWLSEMPAETATEIAARMRGKQDLGFASGLSEITLHAALLRLGFKLEPHPEIPGTPNRPDFLVLRANGERLAYLEITSINPASTQVGRDKREGVVFEGINSAVLPDDLRLLYEVITYGKSSPSERKVRAAIERWAGEQAKAARSGERVEKDFLLDDWRFRLVLLHVPDAGAEGRKIAIHGIMDGRIIGTVPSTDGLSTALDAKASRYGKLDLPFIIAVFDCTDSIAWFSRDFIQNVAAVLLGSEVHEEVMLGSGEVRSRERRANDGWFGSNKAPAHTRVSAVLVFPSASPWYWSEERGQPLLVQHPFATLPLPNDLLPIRELVVSSRESHLVKGRLISEILKLPEPWPPEN